MALNYWNNIYTHFDPIAFSFMGINIHYYGIAYALSLATAIYLAFYFNNRFDFGIPKNMLDKFFIFIELGIILGARIGYILIYDPNTIYYLQNPIEIFNPFSNGEFVGIRGMSYHGAVIGFLLSALLFARIYRVEVLRYLDLIALSVPLAYVFGRIGNFLNQELIGRAIDLDSPFIAITRATALNINGTLCYPSQLIEALLEGLGVFLVVLLLARSRHKVGSLLAAYGIAYSLARYVSEHFRAPDPQLGFLLFGLSMGQILSAFMLLASIALLFYSYRFSHYYPQRSKYEKNDK